MEVVESFAVPHGGLIQLCFGDLTRLDPLDSSDLLVASAFRGNYAPTPTSLIGALSRSGLSVRELASAARADLRATSSCWISPTIPDGRAGRGFDRLLVYEPEMPSAAAEAIGDVFRAIVPFVDHDGLTDIVMPVLASGSMRRTQADMLPAILSTATLWMNQGLEIDRLRIVVYRSTDLDEARRIFRRFAREHRQDGRAGLSLLPAQDDTEYDIFVSYARADGKEAARTIRSELEHLAPHLDVFIDEQSIDVGSSWQTDIARGIARCKRFVAVSTPGFWNSKVCLEEWNMATIRRRKVDDDFIFPIDAESSDNELKLLFETLNYRDCTESDSIKLSAACRELIAQLSP